MSDKCELRIGDALLNTMSENAKVWVKEQTDLSLDEAVAVSVRGCTGGYVLTEAIYRSTRGYHKGKLNLFLSLARAIFSKGFDVVDDCEEDVYKCVMNIDDSDNAIDVAHAKKHLKNSGTGRLSCAGVNGGVLGKNYGGINKFRTLCSKYGV